MKIARAPRAVALAGIVSVLAGGAIAGNASAATSAPPQLKSTSPANGGYAKPSGTSPTISATFDRNLGSGSWLQVYFNGNRVAGGPSTVGSAPLGDPATISWAPSSNWPTQATVYSAHVHAVDASDSKLTSDADFSFTIDGTAPQPPALNQPPVITAANASAFRVTGGAEAGSTVTVTASGAGGLATATGTGTADRNGAFSIPVDTSSIPDGSVSFTATATDKAGNTSGTSATRTTSKDATAPPAPSNLTAADIDGSNVWYYTVSGREFPSPSDLRYISVVAKDADGQQTSGTTSKLDSTGGFTVRVPNMSTLHDGLITITATAYDQVGNKAASSVTVTKDVQGFALLELRPGDQTTDFPPDAISATFSHVLQQTGSTFPPVSGSGMSLQQDGVPLACDVAYSADGKTISCSPGTLTAGHTYTVTVDAYDQPDSTNAQNHINKTWTFTVGAAGVTAAFGVAPVDGSNETAVPVHGTGLAGRPVSLTFSSSGGGPAYAVQAGQAPTAADDGTWSTTVDLSSLADGTLTVTAGQTDPSGFSKSGSATVTKKALPDAPQAVTARAGDAAAFVSWQPPADSGGAAVSGYRITSTDGQSQTVSGTTATFSGLTNGRSYGFSVVTLTTAAPNGGPAASSAAVTPHYATTLTMRATKKVVAYGTTTTLSGLLSRVSTGYGIAGVTLRVYGRYDNGKTALIGQPTTGSVGNWSLVLRPGHNLAVWVTYPGSGIDQPTRTGVGRLLVPALVRVSSNTNGSTSRVGSYLTITGSVAPSFAGRYVQLWAYYSGTHRVVQQVRLDRYSRYVFRVNLRRGTYTLRVVMDKPPLNTTGASGYLRVTRV